MGNFTEIYKLLGGCDFVCVVFFDLLDCTEKYQDILSNTTPSVCYALLSCNNGRKGVTFSEFVLVDPVPTMETNHLQMVQTLKQPPKMPHIFGVPLSKENIRVVVNWLE